MNNTFLHQVQGEMNNNNVPFFRAIVFEVECLSAGSFHININDVSIVKYASTPHGNAIIIGGNSTFRNGAKEVPLSSNPYIDMTTVGDKFLLVCEDVYNIERIVCPNDGNNYKCFIREFPIQYTSLKYFYVKTNSSGKLKDIYLSEGFEYLRFYGSVEGTIKSIPSTATTIEPNKSVTLIAKNAIVGKDLHNIENISIGKVDGGNITIEELAAALCYGNNPCLMTNWGQVMNSQESMITGDVTDIPSNVIYVNLPVNHKDITCTLGQRNTSDCKILAIGGNDASWFKTATDVDNFFINNAGCTLAEGTTYKIMYIKVSGGYTPSSAAQSAISTLYGKGLTSIKVNGVEMSAYR